MDVERISQHVEQAQDRLLEQYKGRPNFGSLVAAFAQHTQQLENALFALSGSFQLDTATGDQLDIIGAIVGAVRNGLSDAQYLALIRGTIAQNNGDSTTESLLTIIRGLFQAQDVFFKTANSVHHKASGPSAYIGVSVGQSKVPVSLYNTIFQQIAKSVAGGVQLSYLGKFETAKAFSMQGTQGWVGGFGDVNNPSVGAPLASVLFSQRP